MNVKITADSTCDLSAEQISRYNITVVPLSITMGDVSYKDRIEISPSEIFEYVDSGRGTCQTSAVNTAEYHDVFSRFSAEYDAVIHFNLSSEMSTCYQNARLAAADFSNVYVIDSRNLSTGTGNLVLDAAEMAESGMDAADIVRTIEGSVQDVEASFVLSSLSYLRKGGRCSALAALGANVLKLKPCIEVRDGVMTVGKKYRGAYDKALIQYVSDRLSGRDDIDHRRIFITYTEMVPEDIREGVRRQVKALGDWQEICESTAGCTISSHCGTVCLGILFFRKHNVSETELRND